MTPVISNSYLPMSGAVHVVVESRFVQFGQDIDIALRSGSAKRIGTEKAQLVCREPLADLAFILSELRENRVPVQHRPPSLSSLNWKIRRI